MAAFHPLFGYHSGLSTKIGSIRGTRLFKETRLIRMWDTAHKTLVYIATRPVNNRERDERGTEQTRLAGENNVKRRLDVLAHHDEKRMLSILKQSRRRPRCP